MPFPYFHVCHTISYWKVIPRRLTIRKAGYEGKSPPPPRRIGHLSYWIFFGRFCHKSQPLVVTSVLASLAGHRCFAGCVRPANSWIPNIIQISWKLVLRSSLGRAKRWNHSIWKSTFEPQITIFVFLDWQKNGYQLLFLGQSGSLVWIGPRADWGCPWAIQSQFFEVFTLWTWTWTLTRTGFFGFLLFIYFSLYLILYI